jgi:hypothetical protein
MDMIIFSEISWLQLPASISFNTSIWLSISGSTRFWFGGYIVPANWPDVAILPSALPPPQRFGFTSLAWQ